MAFDIPKLRRKDTAPYTFHFPGQRTITIETRPLTLETREVFNDAFRERPSQKASGDQYAERMVARAENLATLARCCVVSWDVTEDGQPAPCTPDKALAFLRWLDDEAGYREEVSAYILWAQNHGNFREQLVEASKVGEG